MFINLLHIRLYGIETKMELKKYAEKLEDYLTGWKWGRFTLDGNVQVYAKGDDSAQGIFPDGSKSRKTRFIPLEEVSKIIRIHLINQGYQEVGAIGIVNSAEDTLFTSAGVQMFNRSGVEFPIDKDMYISQPVIRTQFFGSANTTRSSSTSFVNICTERLGTNPENYIKHLDSWLNCLSSLGLYAGYMRLELSEVSNNWGKGRFDGLALKISYRGLEIGDIGILFNVPSLYGENDVCDSGFGLERIASTLNGNYDYYECLWPANKFIKLDRHQLDAIRTATLIAGAGIKPGNNSHGYRLRKFLKAYQGHADIDSTQLINDFYYFWTKFIDLPSDIIETQNTIRQELNRNRNLRILKENGIQEIDLNLSKDTNEFSADLLRRK